MRILLAAVTVLAVLLGSCQPRRDTAVEPDLTSSEWRRGIADRAVVQSRAIHQVAATVFAERARGSGYQDPVSGWVDQLRSDDTGQIISALDAMKQHEREAVPTEVLVALVVPLLEDHRGFSRFLKEPGAMDSVGVTRSVSLCAAKAFGSRTYKNRVLVPVLAEYVLGAENAHCETMATAMMRMVGATKDPDDVEIAAAALYEIMIHDPWTAEEHPWERIESLRSPRVCDHRDRAKRMLLSLAMSYPEVAFLDVVEGFDG